ncbi:MAG: hypothetical protein FWG64_09140 [Firmicutes bacterium]|nr:hypothetical protein [Bacillota bacterium]
MFMGSIPTPVQQILGDIVKNWQTSDIYIGCSGNFTIERVLTNITRLPDGQATANLHSNDVTIYSCLLGNYFSGQPLNAKFNENYTGEMSFVKNYMKDGASIITVALLLSKMAVYLTSKPNEYYKKMIDEHIRQWETMFHKTYEKISNIQPFLKSFFAGDVCEMVDNTPQEAAFICYPPFYSGDYEKMFKAIEGIIDWQPPQYDMIDKDKILAMFQKLTNRRFFMFGTNDELPEFREYLSGIAQTTNRGVPLYIYSKTQNRRIILPNQKIAPLLVERISENEDISDKIQLIKLKSENFQALRSQYMNPHIKPGAETASYGVTVDNKLIGVFAFSASPTLSNWETHIQTPTMYLLSDFPIAPSKYKRLSKLVLYAALSKESQLLAENLTRKRVCSLVTTAFSKNPVSMKYRGLFKLLNKSKLDGTRLLDGQASSTNMSEIYYNSGYKLNYGQKMGEWTLAEGLAEWKLKHAKTEGRAET